MCLAAYQASITSSLACSGLQVDTLDVQAKLANLFSTWNLEFDGPAFVAYCENLPVQGLEPSDFG